ncbi:MAG: tetratricopeptide repeat protein [Candidatus Marinimicrobia bacterium]|nr:tetratricopeptide repeat protein [Candidatus Neomarinimicrobiota bacterium]
MSPLFFSVILEILSTFYPSMKRICPLILWIAVLFGQSSYLSEYEIQKEWKDYTQFQRHELLSFCDFLFENGYYDRAQLSLFRYLYKYPDDQLEPILYYYIARSYEELQKYDLAIEYYSRLTQSGDSTSIAFQNAKYRTTYLHLIKNNMKKVYKETVDEEDPYFLIFRGYALLNELKWSEAKQTLLAAEERFDHAYYSEMIAPLLSSIETAQAMPKKNRTFAMIASVIPGAGQSYLKNWREVAGTMCTAILLYAFTANNNNATGSFTYQDALSNTIAYSNSVQTTSSDWNIPLRHRIPMTLGSSSVDSRILVPPVLIGVGLYVGSIIKTMDDIDLVNRQLVIKYIDSEILKHPASRFLDFHEPELR